MGRGGGYVPSCRVGSRIVTSVSSSFGRIRLELLLTGTLEGLGGSRRLVLILFCFRGRGVTSVSHVANVPTSAMGDGLGHYGRGVGGFLRRKKGRCRGFMWQCICWRFEYYL